MKKTTILLSILLLSLNIIQSQWLGNPNKINGNGNIITKNRNISGYDQVKIKGGLDVSLVEGIEGEIIINGESNLIEYILTEVEGDILKIYVKKGFNLNPSRGAKLIITVPFRDLTQVTLSGSGDVFSSDIIKSTSFKTAVSGSGSINLAIESIDTWAQISGSGDLILKGNTDNFNGSVSGSGDMEAFDLNSKNAKISIAGSGNAGLTVSSSLKSRISGSGNITYKGNPEINEKKISGSGTIRKK